MICKINLKEVKFVIDSGAKHYSLKSEYESEVVNKLEINQKISVAKKGQSINVLEEGDLCVVTDTDRKITIKKVWVCKGLSHNFLFVKKLEEAGLEVIFENKEVTINKNNREFLKGFRNGNLYFVTFKCMLPGSANLSSAEQQMLLHRKMGHSSKYTSPILCETCIRGKQTKVPFRLLEKDRKTTRILEIISTDVCRPIAPATHDGYRYLSVAWLGVFP